MLLIATAVAFGLDAFSAWGQTFAWMLIFFFASAAASSAYLTASEIFPLETRALAIAIFYALGTAVGGTAAPLLFGFLVQSGSAWALAAGYAFAAALMLIAAAIAAKFGIDAEMRSLLNDRAAPSYQLLDLSLAGLPLDMLFLIADLLSFEVGVLVLSFLGNCLPLINRPRRDQSNGGPVA